MSWLTYTVRLPQYVQLFLDYGYESMRMVQGIEGKQDLIDMGIEKVGHQRLFMRGIEKIQGIDFNINMSTNAGCVPPESETIRQQMTKEREMMEEFLKYTVKLPVYIQAFLYHGYDCMRSVQAIEGKEDLIAIGIRVAMHQRILLKEIEKIQSTNFDIHMSTKQMDYLGRLGALRE
eukprot:266233_1